MKTSIRRYKKDDVEALLEAARESVEHISPWLPWCTSRYGIDDARNWVSDAEKNWEAGTDYHFVIEDAATRCFLGAIGINQITMHKTGNMGYWVRKSALNQGVCTEACRLVANFAFSHLGFHRLEIFILPDNHASVAVAEKLGAVFEGVQRNKLFFNGKIHDANSYSLIPGDLAK